MVAGDAATAPPAPPAPVVPPGALGGAPSPPDESLRALLAASRTLALVFAFLGGLLFLVFLALAVLDLVLGRGPGVVVWAVYSLASGVVNLLLWREIPRLERLAREGDYRGLRDQTIVWAVLGVVFYVAVGVLLFVAWARAEMLTHPR